MRKSAFLLAALSSGQGKTTLTLALSEMIKDKGAKPIVYKTGPDYLDTSFYNGYNLDLYFLDDKTLKDFFFTTSDGYNVSIVEGVMGVYDGFDISSIYASSAHMAKTLGIPVILILTPGGSVLTVVSMLKGVLGFDKETVFKGVIFNKLKSTHHYKLLKDAVERYTPLKVYGYLPYDPLLTIPERHLGIFPSWERELNKEKFLDYKDYIDLDNLLTDTQIDRVSFKKFTYPSANLKLNIGIVKDRAFCFYYRENIELLQSLGANIVYISPMEDPVIPPDIDFLYIGGGYPELYMDELSENSGFLHSLRIFGKTKPVYAECGGLMYLSKSITYKGKTRKMAGLFDGEVKFSKKLKGLGYRTVKTKKKTIFGEKDTLLKGHEFHYSYLSDEKNLSYVYKLYKKDKFIKEDGILLSGGGIASYTHLYFLSNTHAIYNMLKSLERKK